jgi:hypothetical protein
MGELTKSHLDVITSAMNVPKYRCWSKSPRWRRRQRIEEARTRGVGQKERETRLDVVTGLTLSKGFGCLSDTSLALIPIQH